MNPKHSPRYLLLDIQDRFAHTHGELPKVIWANVRFWTDFMYDVMEWEVTISQFNEGEFEFHGSLVRCKLPMSETTLLCLS